MSEPASVTLPTAKALELAVWLHQGGRLEEAERVYRAVLSRNPGHPDALHYLGVLHHQIGDPAAAVELIRGSLALDPGNAHAWSNLGNVERAAGNPGAALESYRKATELDPESSAAHNNIGVVLKEMERYAEAEAAYRTAIAIDPSHAEAHRNLGNVLKRQGRIPEALDALARAVVLRPEGASYRNLSYSLYRAGQAEKAVSVVREWLAHEPDNPVALHLLAAFSGEGVPDRASDKFVRDVFDGFAETFDQKLEHLQYRAPVLVAEAVAREMAPPDSSLRVLDAGCGTGLCGPHMRPYAAHLAGVDLSPGMLAKARGRRVYDELAAAELTAFLAARPDTYDLVVSADTLVYFGDLAAVLDASRAALRPGGRVVFTLEDAGEKSAAHGYRLEPHGRYNHARDYVEATVRRAGLEAAEILSVVLRLEGGEPVAGLLVVARRPF